MFYYAYVIIDIFDRSIVGWEVHSQENDAHSRALFERLSRGQDIIFKYLHSDNAHEGIYPYGFSGNAKDKAILFQAQDK